MEKRWNVYHGSDYLGLKTAKEIRESLRSGKLDPFDKVSVEGSNIREDLIDVDEIFREKSSAFNDDPHGTVVASRPHAVGETIPAPQPAPAVAQAPAYNWRNEASAMRFKEEATQVEAQRGPVKRYYIIDREKVLGPLSAHEIQSLYNRGVLNKKVKVQKIGGRRTMSIAQFISTYSGDRMKELAEDGKIPQQIGVGSPSSKVLTELARMASSRRVAQQRQQRSILIVVASGVLLGLIVYLLVQNFADRSPIDRERSSVPSAPELENKPRPSRPRLIQKAPEAPAQRQAPAASAPTTPKTKSVKVEPTRPAKPLPSSPQKTVRNAPPPVRPAQTVRTPPPRREPAAVATPAKSPPPVPSAIPILASSPVAQAILAAGRIQTVGPLSFQINALEECSAKCTLTLRDATGANMKAVFFKNAYYEALKSRSKGVTLTGSTKMDRGELTLIIQDIR